MNRWKKLIAQLKELGFNGDENSLEAVKSFVTENNVTIPNFDLAAEHAKAQEQAKTKTLILDGDEPVEDDVSVVLSPDEINAIREARKAKATGHKAGSRLAGAVADTITHRGGSDRAVEAAKKAYNFRALQGKTHFADADTAESFAAWMRLSAAKQLPQLWHSDKYLAQRDRDVEIVKAGGISTDSLGGALVPIQFIPELIRLTEMYGDARKLVGVRPMSGDTAVFPRNPGGLTAYFPGENNDITASDQTLNNVTLVAKKIAVLAVESNELLSDAAINVADLVARNVGTAIARKEDDCFFLGDGTSTYGNMTGLAGAFRKVVEDAGGTWATNAGNAAGIVEAAGNLASEVTLANLTEVVGRLPQYAAPNAKWVMSRWAWANISTRLSLTPASSGVSYELVNNVMQPRLLGYPIVVAQALPKSDANSQFLAYFGDFSLGAKFGEKVGGYTMAVSADRYFEKDQIAFRFTNRFDIQVHDVGNYSATASSREAGPIIGLLSAAS